VNVGLYFTYQVIHTSIFVDLSLKKGAGGLLLYVKHELEAGLKV